MPTRHHPHHLSLNPSLTLLAPCTLLYLPVQGKHVVVVGAGKTAHDVGVVTSKVAASTTLVARRGHWMAPQQVLGEWAWHAWRWGGLLCLIASRPGQHLWA